MVECLTWSLLQYYSGIIHVLKVHVDLLLDPLLDLDISVT